MRIWGRVLLILAIVYGVLAHTSSAESEHGIRISKLVIESNSLPDIDRQRLIRLFQQRRYPQSEIAIRIQLALQNLGYFKAVVDEPKVAIAMHDGKPIADIAIRVDEGTCYRLGEIQFLNPTVFPADRMRESFSIRKGDRLSNAGIGLGLDELRKLYATVGYVNFVAVPQALTDESSQTINLVIDIQEGEPSDFGYLVLDGVEPHPNAGKALLNSWRTLHGKRYNPIQLHNWLLENRANWGPAARSVSDPVMIVPAPEPRVVNVKLSFPTPAIHR